MSSSRSGSSKYACDSFELSEQYGYLGKCEFCGHTRYEHSVAQRRRNKHNPSSFRRTTSASSNRSTRSTHSTSSRSLSANHSQHRLRSYSSSRSQSSRRSQSQSSRRSSASSRRSSRSRRSSHTSQWSQSSWGSDGSSSYTDSSLSPVVVLPPPPPSPGGKKQKQKGLTAKSTSLAIPMQHLALFQAADAQERARTNKKSTSSRSRSRDMSSSSRRKHSERRRRRTEAAGRRRRNESDSSEEGVDPNPVGTSTSSSSRRLARNNSSKSTSERHGAHSRGRGRGRGERFDLLKENLRVKATEAGYTIRAVAAETNETFRAKAAEAGEGVRVMGSKVKAFRISKLHHGNRGGDDNSSAGASTMASGSSTTGPSSEDVMQTLLKKYAKRGGVRKLHAGVLFSVDVGDAPLGVKIAEKTRNRSGQIGFEVQQVALAGLARKAGVLVGDVLVAIGDQLITRDMMWNEALACILAKQRPLRLTFFRQFSPAEQARRALQAQRCTCETSRTSTRVVQVKAVAGNASGPTLVSPNCPEHGGGGSSSRISSGYNGGREATSGGSVHKRGRRMSRLAQNAQSAVEAIGASVGVPKDTSWHLMEQIHRHRLYFLPELPTSMLWCDICHLRILDSAFHCRACDFDVCTKCLVPRLPAHPDAAPLSRAPKRKGGSAAAAARKHKPTETKPRVVKAVHKKHALTRVPVNDVAENDKTLQHTCDVCGHVCKDRTYRCTTCDFDACEDCITRAITPAPSQHMVRALHRHPLSFHLVDDARKIRDANANETTDPKASSLTAWRKRRFSTSSNGSARSRGREANNKKKGGEGRIFWCDSCDAVANDVVFRCNHCDFDLCEHCFYANAGDPVTTYVGPS